MRVTVLRLNMLFVVVLDRKMMKKSNRAIVMTDEAYAINKII